MYVKNDNENDNEMDWFEKNDNEIKTKIIDFEKTKTK
jgi:hypothetical protein